MSLLAAITVDGRPLGPAALGNIAFDPVHRQLFVSERDTGRIHRLALNGTVLEAFDHGTAGHAAAGLEPLPPEPAGEAAITDPAFDSGNPETWGLAVHGGRLYYAIARGERTGRPEVWSVGIDPETGALGGDARFELALPEDAPDDEISDIAFTIDGAMIVALRGAQRSGRDYRTFARTGDSRVYRLWREVPDDPTTESRWRAPEEHAVGFRPDHRNTNGGIALGYGYAPDGTINPRLCSGTLWTTGEALRWHPSRAVQEKLKARGFLPVIGIQGAPARPVRPENTPPWHSYMIDHDGAVRPGDEKRRGAMGDVEVFSPGCTRTPRTIATPGKVPAPDVFSPWNYPPDPPWTYPPDEPPSCTWESGCVPPGWPPEPVDPGLEIAKSCDLAVKDEESGQFVAECRITVTGNGNPPLTPIVVSESLGGAGTIVSWSSTDPWMCGPVPPVSAGTPLTCALWPQDFVAAGYQSTITVKVAFGSIDALDKARNCATLARTGATGKEEVQACTGFAAIKVEKALDPETKCKFGTPCTYTITVTNLSATTPYSGPVVIADQMTGGTFIVTSITPACTPTPVQTPFACTANVNLPPGGSQTFTVTGMLVPPTYSKDNIEVGNCATVGSPPPDLSGEWWKDYVDEAKGATDCERRVICAFSCHMEDISGLEIEKRLKEGDCRPGTQCTFTITVRNTGTSDRAGPLSIVDTLPNGAIFVSASPLPWTCAPSVQHPGNAIVCKYPPPPSPPVPAGGSLSVDVTIAVPPDYKEKELKNCAAFDIDPRIMPARLTRLLGVTDLSGEQALQRLTRYLRLRGYAPAESRKEAARLLDAFQIVPPDLPDIDPRKVKSCITVPLPQEEEKTAPRRAAPAPVVPPAAKPPVRKAVPEKPRRKTVKPPACDRRTTVRRGNRCVCRFGGARKISATRCACPRGTRLNPKRGRCEPVRKRIVCRKPAFPNRKGTACLCPRGWEPDGRRGCRKVVQEPPRIRCLPPAFPVREGRTCACPRGWRKVTPFACVPVIPDDNDDDHPRGNGPRRPH